jgi:hypothetical protein
MGATVIATSSSDEKLERLRTMGAAQVINSHPVIDRSFPLAEIAEAFRLQESGGHFGKIVVEFLAPPQLSGRDIHENSRSLRAPRTHFADTAVGRRDCRDVVGSGTHRDPFGPLRHEVEGGV